MRLAGARSTGAGAIRLLAVMAIAGGVGVATSSAQAAFIGIPETGSPGFLSLATDRYPIVAEHLAPGESTQFLVETRLSDAESGTLDLQLRGRGAIVDHASGLTIAIGSCAGAYDSQGVVCPAGETAVIPPTRLGEIATETTSGIWMLDELVAAHPRYLRVTLALPAEGASDESLQGIDGWFAIGLYASGFSTMAGGPDEPSAAAAPDRLAETGAGVLAMALTAGGAIVFGSTMRSRGTPRSEASR